MPEFICEAVLSVTAASEADAAYFMARQGFVRGVLIDHVLFAEIGPLEETRKPSIQRTEGE